MTIQEFKKEYPQYAHLDGNELWDIMEDEYIKAHPSDIVNEILDWKGNKVVAGDIIRIINPDDWENGKEHEVLTTNGILYYDAGSFNGFSFNMALNAIFLFPGLRILVIKGKSDNKEEYIAYAKTKDSFRSNI